MTRVTGILKIYPVSALMVHLKAVCHAFSLHHQIKMERAEQ